MKRLVIIKGRSHYLFWNTNEQPVYICIYIYIYVCVCVYVFYVLWYLILRPALHMLVLTAVILIFNYVCIHTNCIFFILDYRIRITQHFVWFVLISCHIGTCTQKTTPAVVEYAFSKTDICFIIDWRFRSKNDNQQLELKKRFNEWMTIRPLRTKWNHYVYVVI